MSDEQTESTESKMKFKLAFPYDINISPTMNGGAIIHVGCAQLSYDNTNKLLKALREYFADPAAAEKAYVACNALRAGPQYEGEVARPSLSTRPEPEPPARSNLNPDRPVDEGPG